MILDKEVEVTIINHNFEHYKKLGYNVKYKNKIMVKPEELSSGSHCIIKCACDNCSNETNIKYQDYLKVFNKNKKYICEKCRLSDFYKFNKSKNKLMKDSRLLSVKEKYNVDNVFQLKTVKEKIKEIFLLKYGFEHFRQNEQIKEKEKQTRIKNGTQISDDLLTEYEKYRKIVHNIDPYIIGGLDNLCITKRINNLSKGSLYSKPKRLQKD